MPDIPNKTRVSIIAIRDGKLLLIKRIKSDVIYYTFPGGTVEDNETPEEAVIREGLEELSHPIEIDKLLFEDKVNDRHDYYFLIKDFKGEPRMGEPEASRITDDNNYVFEWIPMDKIQEMDNFYIPDIRPKLLNWWNSEELIKDIRNALISVNETVGELEYTSGNYDDKGNHISGSIPTITTDSCEIGVYDNIIYFTFIIRSDDFNKELLGILPDNTQVYPFKDFNNTLYPNRNFNYSEFEQQIKQDKYIQINFNDNYKDNSMGQLVQKYFEYKELFVKSNITPVNQLEGLFAKRNLTILHLPFKGKWFVNWGGDTEELNQHHSVLNQKYAFDFIVIDDDKMSYKGDGKQNDNYYAFGKEIIAPADGKVIKVFDSIDNNIPGKTNKEMIFGNAVLIKHKEGEVSVLAHLKKDSIQVKVGDSVKTGQVIGLCGNSGNSTEPHLHYHLQDSEDIYSGEGIKCFFQNVNVKNKDKQESKYSPVMDDIVSQG